MNKKIYTIGFFIMIITNISMIIFFLATKPSHPQTQQQGILKDRIIERLNLDEKQQSDFQKAITKHKDQMHDYNQEQEKLSKEYFNSLADGNTTENGALAKAIGTLQEKKLKITYAHFRELRSLCNESQLEAYKECMDDMTRVLIRGNAPAHPNHLRKPRTPRPSK